MGRFSKKAAALMAFILSAAALSGCSPQESASIHEDKPLSVYTTFYPFYALTDMLAQDVQEVQLHCLVQPQDGCLRNYQLSNWDLALLSGAADLIIAGGSGLESFEDTLLALGETGPVVSLVLENMDLIGEPVESTLDENDSHWAGENPHIYLTIAGAQDICDRIAASLCLLDADNESVYRKNLQTAQNRLESFRTELQTMLDPVQGEKVFVLNEALVYAAEEYGVKAAGYYDRESGEGMQDFDLNACLEALSASDARVILIEKQAPQSLCEALTAAGYRTVRMDVLSTRRAGEGSEAYFEAHRENAAALLEAFADTANAG